nr:dienelactone hydrolase family protein [uncultured Nitrososphaera sp.]
MNPRSAARIGGAAAVAVAIAVAVWIGTQRVDAAQSNVAMLGTGKDVSKVETSTVEYYNNTSGFLAKPAGDGKYPGIVMLHEWWGLNDNIKEMARQMASEGYVVLAADLYKGQVTTASSQAQVLATGVKNNPGEAIKNLQAAVSYLRNSSSVDGKIGSLGWCFGGDWSLQLALNENKMDATGLYYGQPVTDPKALSVIKWPVLGIFGSADQSIPVEKVNAFKQALDKDGIVNEVHVYNGVGHAFANPSGANYAPAETKDAWQKTLAFFDKHLKES